MSSAFTPGPWEVWEGSIALGPLRVVNSRIGWTIYSIEDSNPAEDATHLANALLIAAAPDLVLAAQMLEDAEDFNANDCRECEGEGVPELCPVCFPKFDDARVARRAAIAKALGPQVPA